MLEESAYRHKLLIEALAALPERERHIISERQLRDEPMTLEQLGAVYGISRERIRQLEAPCHRAPQENGGLVRGWISTRFSRINNAGLVRRIV